MTAYNKILTLQPVTGKDKRCPHCNSFNLRMEQTITDGTVQCQKCKVGITAATLQLARKIWNMRVGVTAGDRGVPRKLSEAFSEVERYAKCSHCGEVFIDDLPNWGSILCPNDTCTSIEYCVTRGLTKEQIS